MSSTENKISIYIKKLNILKENAKQGKVMPLR